MRQREDFYPCCARFGDPNLVGCRDIANVVRTGGERSGSDDGLYVWIDDIEPLRVPICCEQKSMTLVCRCNALTVSTGERCAAGKSANGSNLLGLGIDQIQISGTAGRHKHFVNRGSKSHIVKADTALAAWKSQRRERCRSTRGEHSDAR